MDRLLAAFIWISQRFGATENGNITAISGNLLMLKYHARPGGYTMLTRASGVAGSGALKGEPLPAITLRAYVLAYGFHKVSFVPQSRFHLWRCNKVRELFKNWRF
jgi:hypothetical protein